jgi:hypothetical protein
MIPPMPIVALMTANVTPRGAISPYSRRLAQPFRLLVAVPWQGFPGGLPATSGATRRGGRSGRRAR